MSNSNSWTGLFPALWTPTDGAGRILRTELTDQVRFLRAAGADGLMVLGSTGEFVHLDVARRKEVLRVVAEAEPGWPLIANCSDVNPRHVAELGIFAREVGAPAISLLPPWFFAVAAVDVVEFMVRGAESAGLPLLIYNFPERTGHRLALESIAAVCDRVPVVALKQSGGEFGYHRDLAALAAEKRFTLITGADTRMAEAHALGARGVVSGLANAIPEWVVGAWRSVQRGDPPPADTSRALADFAAGLAGLEFPVDVAAAMEARGRPIGVLKSILSAATRSRYDAVVNRGREALRIARLS